MIKINEKIIDANVNKPATIEILKRPEQLSGVTYKIKPGTIKDAIYITINNMDDRVYEMFVATKNPDQAYHLGAIARLVSALWRREKNPEFIINELKAMRSQAGYWEKNRYHESIIAHIAHIIELHMISLGALKTPVEVPNEPEICLDCED